MTCAILCTTLTRGELRGLEVVLGTEGSCLVVTKGLSIAIVAASTEAIAAAVAPIASILGICAKGFIWSIIKPSTIIPVPKIAKISPSRWVTIPTVISEITTSASPWTTWKKEENLFLKIPFPQMKQLDHNIDCESIILTDNHLRYLCEPIHFSK